MKKISTVALLMIFLLMIGVSTRSYSQDQKTQVQVLKGMVNEVFDYMKQNQSSNFSLYYESYTTKLALRDTTGALEDLSRAMAEQPNFVLLYELRGELFTKMKRNDDAERDFANVLSSKQNYLTYYNRGTLRLNRQDYIAAQSDFEAAIALNPDFAQAYTNLGNTFYAKGDKNNAIAKLQKAIDLDKNSVIASSCLAYVQKNDISQSQPVTDYKMLYEVPEPIKEALAPVSKLELLELYLKLYPESVEAMKERLKLSLKANDPEGFGKYFGQLLKRDPLNAYEYYFIYAEYKSSNRAYAEAEDYYTKSIRERPSFPSAYSGRAKVRSSMNMIDSARKDFDNAIRLEPKSPGLYKLRGIFFRDQKNDPMALADFNKALEINPDDREAQSLKDGVAVSVRKYEDDIKYYKATLNRDPNDVTALIGISDTYAKMQKDSLASIYYDKLISVDSRNKYGLKGRAVLRISNKQYELAIQDLNQYINIVPTESEGYDLRARAREKQLGNSGKPLDYVNVIADYDQAIKLKATPAYYLSRGKAKELKLDLKAAVLDYDTYITLRPDDPNGFVVRAKAKRQMKDFAGAQDDLSRALQFTSNNIDALFERGFLRLYNLDNKQGAKEDWQKAASLGSAAAKAMLEKEFN